MCVTTTDVPAAANTNDPATYESVGVGPGLECSPVPFQSILINLGAVVVPLAGLVVALFLLWGIAFDVWYLMLLAGMFIFTTLGVTVGYHRLCTHKSFETSPAMRYALAAIGSMAAEGPVIRWCAEHRKHHQHSDDVLDPHSPHMAHGGSWGEGFRGTVRGAFHAHVGWLFTRPTTDLYKYSLDLRNDMTLVMANKHFPYWLLVGLALPALLGGVISMSWTGVLLGFLWGGLVRVFCVHHVTWSINSICHLWGTRSYHSHDESRNNPLLAVLGMGEGWHNNHHAFPTSARHGLSWWQLDLSYVVIRLMQMLRLAHNVRVPDKAKLASKRL